MTLPSNSGRSSPSIQQSEAGCGNGTLSPQSQRPVSCTESASGLLASKSEIGRSCTVSARRPTERIPVRAHTVTAAPISLRVELVERQTKFTEQASNIPERRPVARSVPRSPSYPRTPETQSDIELDDLPLPPVTAYSTEHLVPSPDEVPSDSTSSHLEDHHNPYVNPTGNKTASNNKLRPNFKPLSLRWPFRVFILAIIAGLIAFLEYHIHDLPPLHYSVIDANPARPARLKEGLDVIHHPACVKRSDIPHTKPVILNRAGHGPTTIEAPVTRPVVLRHNRRSPAPDPDPDPRPPESSYPVPDYYQDMYHTYCGWSAPRWKIENWAVPCSTFSCDKWPILCSETNNTQLQCSQFDLSEAIGTFLTDDPSWCPCGVWQEDDWIAKELDNIEYSWWDTIDRGCKSVMLAIQSLNHYKSARLYDTVKIVQTTEDVPYPGTFIAEQFYTTPPLPAQGYWAYPSRGENGEILMPFVVRTAGPEVKDVFGNHVASADIATFPEAFVSLWVGDDVNRCWASGYSHNIEPSSDRGCTNSPSVIRTEWWTLPHGNGKTAVTSTTEGHISSTSSTILQPGGTTSSAEVRSTSTPPAPTSTVVETAASSAQTTEDSSVISSPTPTHSDQNTPSSGGSSEVSTSTESNLVTSSSEDNSGISMSSSTGSWSDIETQSNSRTTTPSSTHPESSTLSTGDNTGISAPSNGMSTSPPPPTSLEPTDRPAITSSAQSETDHETTSGPTSAGVVLVGVSPKDSSSTSANPSRHSAQAISSHQSHIATTPRTNPQQPTAKSFTTLRTEFNLNGSPTRTFTFTTYYPIPTNTSSPPASASASPLLIPPPPYPIPTGGSGWLPRPDPPPGGGPISPQSQSHLFNLRTEADYLLASVFPVLLATALLIPIQVFTGSVNCYLPFRALGYSNARAAESVMLARSGSLFVSQPRVSYVFLREFKDPLPFLNVLLGTLALVLVPLSSEVIRLELTRDCLDRRKEGYFPGLLFSRVCAMGLRKAPVVIRVGEGILVLMAVVVGVMGWLLGRWRSGVAAEPWSVASMAGLLAGERGRREEGLGGLLRSIPPGAKDVNAKIKELLRDKAFTLGFIDGPDGETSYGIIVTTLPLPPNADKNPIRATTHPPPNRKPRIPSRPLLHLPLPSLHVLALLLTTGLLILTLYYETVVRDSRFERFMSSQSFGVRILFTAFGTAISGFWDHYFLATSEATIHRRLARAPQPAPSSILLSPPLNIFSGLALSVGGGTRDVRDGLEFAIALATVLAKFTPILLSNVPFHNTVTWKIHEACTWMAVLVLGYMVLVLAVSSVVSWRGRQGKKSKKGREVVMPVRVNTIAGAMYYLCDSGMVKDFEGLSTRGAKERRDIVCGMGKRYMFGEIVGVSGPRSVGVDYSGEMERGGRLDVERQR